MSEPRVDIKDVWAILDGTASVLELRAFNIETGGTRAQLFHQSKYKTSDDLKKAFEAKARELNAQGLNVYVVMNSIRDDLESGSCTDKDIKHRDWLLIDIDRAKTNGAKHKHPASNEEIKHAIDLAKLIMRFMSEHGWGKPVVVFSGNGIHLYHPLNKLPNDDKAKEAIKDVLDGLGRKFDNAHVEVDTAVHNSGRLTKFIGTVARKGVETEGREYRRAKLVIGLEHPPKNIDALQLLESTAEKLEQEAPSKKKTVTKRKLSREASNNSSDTSTPPVDTRLDDTPNNNAKLENLLRRISADCHREDWKRIILAIMSTGFLRAEDIAYQWSVTSDRYTDTDFNNLIGDYKDGIQGKDGSISIGTIYHHAYSMEAVA